MPSPTPPKRVTTGRVSVPKSAISAIHDMGATFPLQATAPGDRRRGTSTRACSRPTRATSLGHSVILSAPMASPLAHSSSGAALVTPILARHVEAMATAGSIQRRAVVGGVILVDGADAAVDLSHPRVVRDDAARAERADGDLGRGLRGELEEGHE